MAKSNKVLILTSNGGTGQQSISKAMHEHLAKQYELIEVNVTTDIMVNFDPLKYLHKKLNTEVVYNWLIKKNYFLLLNLFVKFGTLLMKFFLAGKLQQAFQNVYQKERPDIVISLVPYYNAYAIKALGGKKPFIIVCCDIDVKGYLFDWPKTCYENLSFCIPVMTPNVFNTFKGKNIEQEKVHVLGYPLRKSFYHKRLTPTDARTITLLLGGQGSEKCVSYIKKLCAYSSVLSINVCIGHNERLAEKIKQLSVPKNITINIIHFTEEIVKLLSASDLLITKTGSSSIFEALQLSKPILMDCTSTQLFWERANVDYVKKAGVGIPIFNLNQCVPIVTMLLASEEKFKEIKNNYDQLNMPNFFQGFMGLLSEKITKQ